MLVGTRSFKGIVTDRSATATGSAVGPAGAAIATVRAEMVHASLVDG